MPQVFEFTLRFFTLKQPKLDMAKQKIFHDDFGACCFINYFMNNICDSSFNLLNLFWSDWIS